PASHRARHPFPTRRSSDLAPCADPPSGGLAREDERDVVAAEPHGVGERDRDLCLARAIRDVVEIALGVADLLIDRRREDALAHRDRKSTRLNSSHVSISYA